MNLREAWISEQSAFFVRSPDRRRVTSLRIGRKKENISVSARAKQHRMRAVCFNFSRYQIPGNDTPGLSFHQDDVEHFCSWKHLDFAVGNLTVQGRVGTQ